jgi:hypothetical protein
MADVIKGVKDAVKNAVHDVVHSDTNKVPDLVDESNTTQNLDAEMLKEAIAQDDAKGISVDVGADYEAAQEMSTGLDIEEAEATVAPEFEVSTPAQVSIPTLSANDPLDYADMAKDVSPASAGAGNVTDDLMEKALNLGKPGS